MKVLKVGAVWCSGCLVMKPRWKDIEKENPWLETEYIEYDENPDLVKKYNIEEGKLPVFIFLSKDGKELLRLHGEISKKDLLKKVNKYKEE
jgi:thiol-disulfide isomerase/thioredoxin